MPGIMFNRIRLASAIRVDQFHDHQILVVDTARFRNGQRVALNSFDGAPHIDDLDTSLEQLLRFVRKMVRHARQRSRIRLVDMHALNRAAQFSITSFRTRRWRATDSVIEDEDARCASPEIVNMLGRLQRLGQRTHP
jgi:hypothetical protein